MTHVALIDCDSFYVSCEKVFKPWIHGRPVVVLSNNDGCAVSRSSEAKEIGIQMGAPYFAFRELLEKNNGLAFSSNYELYNDMSCRVMKVLEDNSEEVERYSIDEAFTVISSKRCDKDSVNFAERMAFNVRKWTGIPVSIGVAKTKTLAKVAGKLAKKTDAHAFAFMTDDQRRGILAKTCLVDVWGINAGLAGRLLKNDIRSALDLAEMDIRTARKLLSVVGARILLELRGQPCLPLETIAPKKKNICRSRSFSGAVTRPDELREAIMNHISHAAEDLRRDRLVAKRVGVFIYTDRFREDQPQYFGTQMVKLASFTDSTRELRDAALSLLKRLFRPGYKFRKAGIELQALAPIQAESGRLFFQEEYERDRRLGAALDEINSRHGRDVLRFGLGAASHINWKMKRDRLSPCYTTDIDQILRVKV